LLVDSVESMTMHGLANPKPILEPFLHVVTLGSATVVNTVYCKMLS